MRVLLSNKETNSLETLEITSIGYAEPLFDGDETPTGLRMFDTDGDVLYIDGISRDQANEICEEIFKNGHADLRDYGDYYYTVVH